MSGVRRNLQLYIFRVSTEEKVYVNNDQAAAQSQQQPQPPSRQQKWAIIAGVASLLFVFDGLQVGLLWSHRDRSNAGE